MLPPSHMAAAAFSEAPRNEADPRMFNTSYSELSKAWLKVRKHLGITDRLATLKRSAARLPGS
jgi:hypothetical protein